MNRAILADRYTEILSNIEGIEEKMIPIYVRELVRRHRHGWALPTTTYRRCKDLLLYKESLSRNSPYYVDLLRIEDRNSLKVVLLDLCKTIRIKNDIYD